MTISKWEIALIVLIVVGLLVANAVIEPFLERRDGLKRARRTTSALETGPGSPTHVWIRMPWKKTRHRPPAPSLPTPLESVFIDGLDFLPLARCRGQYIPAALPWTSRERADRWLANRPPPPEYPPPPPYVSVQVPQLPPLVRYPGLPRSNRADSFVEETLPK